MSDQVRGVNILDRIKIPVSGQSQISLKPRKNFWPKVIEK